MTGFDPYHPDFIADPYPVYRRLIAESPVFEDEKWGLTFFATHRDVSAILKDRERFGRDFRHRLDIDEVDPDLYRRIYPPQWPTWTRYIRESFIDLEPPRHTRLRRLVSAAFTRRSSEAFRAKLEDASARIVEHALEQGEIEIIADFATPVPLAMIAELMGVPPADQPQLVAWSHRIVRVFDTTITPEAGEAAEQAVKDFVAYLEDLVSYRRTSPGDDLVSAMLAVEESGDVLTDEEIVGTSILTLNAGHEATVHAIGNALYALARDPVAYGKLRDGSADVSSAVDELLRFDSPLQMFERWVLEDTKVSGQELKAGTKVGLIFGAANHDPAVFDEPERLALDRHPNPHVSFGAGLHYCVGAPLAKVELEAALGSWAERITMFQIEGEPARLDSFVFRGFRELPAVVTAA
jgi:cytochrome P450